jgi:ATP-dependent Lhr-like helicase
MRGNNNISVFQSLTPKIQQLLVREGIVKPTKAQELAIPNVLARKNILLIAPTGAGKTEAVVLPLFHLFLEKWINDAKVSHDAVTTKKEQKELFKGISILYVTPLRALNRDMLARLKDWGEVLGIDVAVRHGDTTQKERRRLGKRPPNMLITTPETLQILLISKNLRQHLKHVQAIVIDEVHELAQDERGAQLAIALERLESSINKHHPLQRLGLSATVGTPQEIANYISGTENNVEILKAVDIKDLSVEVENSKSNEADRKLIEKLGADPTIIASMRRVKKIVDGHKSVLVFINTRDGAESLAARFKLWEPKWPIGVHHGSLSRDVRIQMEDDFKNQRLKGLICTSSLELGIDIGSADFTVQYNSPREVTRLIQRVGRAGHRLGEISKGKVITTSADELGESIVIARRAMAGQLEQVTIRQKPLGVLANQLAAYCMGQKRAEVKNIYQEIIQSYPFRSLSWEEYLSVLNQMREVHAIWVEDEEFGKKRNTINYFYNNISMIPDEKTYNIIDITTRQHVGQLDEGFVSVYIMPLAKFIIKGEPWRVVELTDDDRILVEPASEIGAIPGWVGEEIPVPFEVAQEVGELRAEISKILSEIEYEKSRSNNGKIPTQFQELLNRYPVDDESFRSYIDYVYTQKQNFPVPTNKLIIIDSTQVPEPIIVINACFGSKVNETIGHVLSALIASKIGASVGVRTDPYRIILELSARINPKMVGEHLNNINPDELEPLLRLVLKNSAYLKWQLLHVGRKFGAIQKDIDHKQVNVARLLDNFMNSPLYEEAINKILWEKLDIPRTKEILLKLQRGELKLENSQLSHIGKAGLEMRKDLMAPTKADRAILLALKRRLEKDYVKFVCLNCKRTYRRTIHEMEDKIKCNYCNGVLLAVIPMHESETMKLLKSKGRLSSSQRKELSRLRTNANLVMSYGKRAVIALSARGVGANTAARILARQHEDELELLRDILKAEVNYARTRRFWD